MSSVEGFSLAESIKAQQALRKAANMPAELFPVQAFVGMISDEVEQLRTQGMSDEEIVAIIEYNSDIQITPEQLAENYATAEERQGHGH